MARDKTMDPSRVSGSAAISPRNWPLSRGRSTIAFMMERRQKRSSDRAAALQLFIASQREKLAAEALTVMDASGKTIAGVGEIDESRTGNKIATWEMRARDEWIVPV